MFISLYSAALTNSLKVSVSELNDKSEDHDDEVNDLKSKVDELVDKIDTLEEELEQLRWRQ